MSAHAAAATVYQRPGWVIHNEVPAWDEDQSLRQHCAEEDAQRSHGDKSEKPFHEMDPSPDLQL